MVKRKSRKVKKSKKKSRRVATRRRKKVKKSKKKSRRVATRRRKKVKKSKKKSRRVATRRRKSRKKIKYHINEKYLKFLLDKEEKAIKKRQEKEKIAKIFSEFINNILKVPYGKPSYPPDWEYPKWIIPGERVDLNKLIKEGNLGKLLFIKNYIDEAIAYNFDIDTSDTADGLNKTGLNGRYWHWSGGWMLRDDIIKKKSIDYRKLLKKIEELQN